MTSASTVVESQIDGAGQRPPFIATGLVGNYLRVASNAPDGNHLVVNDLQDLSGMYVASTTSPTRTLVGELNGTMQPVWSPDGARIAAAMGNGQIEIGPPGSTQTPIRLNTPAAPTASPGS
ncbi:hypothetical protein ABH920_006358 [Catenulispora sp. EB89]|uniref:hypothetical protein n=1 Tax=Catenulispora sp. EB89 TaxID=3156257 RepID=UPI0035165A8F